MSRRPVCTTLRTAAPPSCSSTCSPATQPTALNRAAGSAFLGDALIPTTVPIASLPKLAQWLGSHATASRITAGALRTACNELRAQTPAPLVGPILATAARATPALAYDDGFFDQVGVSSAGRALPL